MPSPIATPINTRAALTAGNERFAPETLTVTAPVTLLKGTILARDSVSLKAVTFVKGGSTNQNGIPKLILPHDLTVAGSGATDVKIRALIAADVVRDKLVIAADGNASNVDAAVMDQLRDYGFNVLEAETQLNIQDN
jgi:hypothetical protein